MTGREKWLRNVELKGCDFIPCAVGPQPAAWRQHGESLRELANHYADIFGAVADGELPFHEMPPVYRKGELFTDNWGCTWANVYEGIEGQIVEAPLSDWSALDTFRPPDPMTQAERGPRQSWDDVKAWAEETRKAGGVVMGFTDRFYERVHFCRGFENFMIDVAEGRVELERLIDIVLEHNMKLVEKWIELGADQIAFADDLGMQDRMQISPQAWRKYFKPGYAMMFEAARSAEIHTWMHSDGYIVDILPDLVEIGISVMNLQDLCNGLDNIERHLKGTVCVDLDVDRQRITAFGTPEEIDAHILNCVATLGSPDGGLALSFYLCAGTPIENVEALCAAMAKYRTYWARD